ncbi:GNAT family N-acetyltransferase [Paenibacillus solani]|nr:GNAT family N-acetyltransferase [Paenibacillus solani]
MEIQVFSHENADAVIHLMKENSFQFPDMVIERYPDRWRQFIETPTSQSHYYVARLGDKIVGHAGYIWNDEDSIFEIVGVVVSLNKQRQGIGQRLIEWICQDLKLKGEQQVFLTTLGHERNEGTVAFYERLGFENVKNEQDYFTEGYSRITFWKKLEK